MQHLSQSAINKVLYTVFFFLSLFVGPSANAHWIWNTCLYPFTYFRNGPVIANSSLILRKSCVFLKDFTLMFPGTKDTYFPRWSTMPATLNSPSHQSFLWLWVRSGAPGGKNWGLCILVSPGPQPPSSGYGLPVPSSAPLLGHHCSPLGDNFVPGNVNVRNLCIAAGAISFFILATLAWFGFSSW